MLPDFIDIAEKDGRYAWEAYEFVHDALGHAQRMFDTAPPRDGTPVGDEHHISGRELLEGACALARREFGLMAPVVFERWGITRTDDIGEIVFAMIEGGVLSKNDSDRKEDFQNVFDLETAVTDGYDLLEEIDSGWGK